MRHRCAPPAAPDGMRGETHVKSYDPIPHKGILGQIFYLTNAQLHIFGWPAGGYSINLIQLIILLIIAVVVVYVTERLTRSKIGGLAAGVIVTLLGAFLLESLTTRIPDFIFEGVRVLTSLIGAIIVGVFYVLIRAQFGKSGGH
jgi:uncharacterized membrane protein YeaQ/YmgE (transglycosylase-associated protein family)